MIFSTIGRYGHYTLGVWQRPDWQTCLGSCRKVCGSNAALLIAQTKTSLTEQRLAFNFLVSIWYLIMGVVIEQNARLGLIPQKPIILCEMSDAWDLWCPFLSTSFHTSYNVYIQYGVWKYGSSEGSFRCLYWLYAGTMVCECIVSAFSPGLLNLRDGWSKGAGTLWPAGWGGGGLWPVDVWVKVVGAFGRWMVASSRAGPNHAAASLRPLPCPGILRPRSG